MRQPNALRLTATKPPTRSASLCSASQRRWAIPSRGFGPSRFLEVLLQQRFPDRDFEIVNVAFTAINSHVLPAALSRECAQRDGDLWIIYMGNNEMWSAHAAQRPFSARKPRRARWSSSSPRSNAPASDNSPGPDAESFKTIPPIRFVGRHGDVPESTCRAARSPKKGCL